MLNNVSWGQYFSGVIIILILYYLVIAPLFYRDAIQSFLRPKDSPSDAGQQNDQQPDHNDRQKQSDEATDGLKQVVSDLRGILEAGSEASKEQLLEQFSQRLANYAGLRLPAFRAAITNYIITQAKDIRGVSFSEQELTAEWDALLA